MGRGIGCWLPSFFQIQTNTRRSGGGSLWWPPPHGQPFCGGTSDYSSHHPGTLQMHCRAMPLMPTPAEHSRHLWPTFLPVVGLRPSVALQPSRRHPWGRGVHGQQKAPWLLSAPFQALLTLCPVPLCKATAQRQPRPCSAQLPSSPSHNCEGGGSTQTAEARGHG